jgi:TIR domain
MGIIRRTPITTYVSSTQAGLPVNSVFISYRRKTAASVAATLRLILERELGDHVPFRDIESILPGDAFRQTIIEALEGCRVFLLLIDPSWHTERGRQRLEEPDDYVRFELETALARRPSVRIVPVLINGAPPLVADDLPAHLASLVQLQAVQLGEGEHFKSSVERIISRVRTPV